MHPNDPLQFNDDDWDITDIVFFESGLDSVIRKLSEEPSLCHETNPGDNNLLHIAAASGPLNTVNHLASTYPELLDKINYQDDYPIHVAANSNRADVLDCIVSLDPLQAKKQNGDGKTIIDIVERSNNLALVQWLVETYSVSISATDKMLQNVLKLAIIYNQEEIIAYCINLPLITRSFLENLIDSDLTINDKTFEMIDDRINKICPLEGASEDIPELFIEKPNGFIVNRNLFCPISQELMYNPVVASDGHTYERRHIEQWFKRGNKTSPLTNDKISTALYPSQIVKSQLRSIRHAAEKARLSKSQIEKDNLKHHDNRASSLCFFKKDSQIESTINIRRHHSI